MASAVIRSWMAVMFWIAVLVIVIGAGAWQTVEHYLQLKNAFELLGTEKAPLWRDPLVGPLLGALAPSAGLPHAQALTFALGEPLALFLCAHGIFQLLEMKRHVQQSRSWRQQQLEIDPAADTSHLDAQIFEAKHRIVVSSVALTTLAVLLILTFACEIELNRFRMLAAAKGIEDSALAPTIEVLSGWFAAPGPTYGTRLASLGAWAYAALTAVLAVALELTGFHLKDSFNLAMAPVDRFVDRLLNGGDAETEGWEDGYDDSYTGTAGTGGEPADGGDTADPESGGARWDPLPNAGGATSATWSPEPAAAPQAATAPAAAPQPQASAGSRRSSVGDPLLDPLPRPTNRAARPRETVEPNATREVLGAEGLRITLADARANPDRYHVDLASGRIWTREAWEVLHEDV